MLLYNLLTVYNSNYADLQATAFLNCHLNCMNSSADLCKIEIGGSLTTFTKVDLDILSLCYNTRNNWKMQYFEFHKYSVGNEGTRLVFIEFRLKDYNAIHVKTTGKHCFRDVKNVFYRVKIGLIKLRSFMSEVLRYSHVLAKVSLY